MDYFSITLVRSSHWDSVNPVSLLIKSLDKPSCNIPFATSIRPCRSPCRSHCSKAASSPSNTQACPSKPATQLSPMAALPVLCFRSLHALCVCYMIKSFLCSTRIILGHLRVFLQRVLNKMPYFVSHTQARAKSDQPRCSVNQIVLRESTKSRSIYWHVIGIASLLFI